MPDPLLIKTLVVIVAAIAAVGLFAWMRLPVVLGYLAAGVIIGPHGLQILSTSAETDFLAELGVIFLMFMVGLGLSVPSMLEERRDMLGAGSLQVIITTLLVSAAALLLNLGVAAAFVLGGAVAMSSTAITVKQLTSQGELSSHYGRLSIGILLFQDLATLPFLVVIGAWARGAAPEPSQVTMQLLIAAAALGGIVLICRPGFRAMLLAVARVKSTELFLLVNLLMALGTAFAADLAGLEPPIGAFLAGVAVAESDFRHQIEDDVRPFRDVLLGLFFITVGMEIDFAIATAAPLAVFVWLIAFVPGKALILSVIGAIIRWPVQVSTRMAIILAHGGEFGLLLLTQAMHVGVIEASVGQPALLALAATLGIAPILIQYNGAITQLLTGRSQCAQESAETAIAASRHLVDHVLLCGCGRVGRLVALVLEAAKVPYIALELDVERFRLAQRQGHNVVFGDATRKRLLETAGLARARVIAITFDHRRALERILHYVRQENPSAATIVSATDDRDLPVLVRAGAGTVFPENFAAGLSLADQVLLLSGFSQEATAEIVTAVRTALSPELSGHVGI